MFRQLYSYLHQRYEGTGSCIAAETFGFIFLLIIGEENYNVKYTTQSFKTIQGLYKGGARTCSCHMA